MSCNKEIKHRNSINRSSTPYQSFKMPFDLRGVKLRITYQQNGNNVIERTKEVEGFVLTKID